MIPLTFKTIELQLITPCYCAGATPRTPEIRAASFRGELRWWFRCLGGTREQEGAVFGAAGKRDEGVSSSVALLVRDVSPNKTYSWEPERQPKKDAPANSTYITYLLNNREPYYLAPGTIFTLEMRKLRKLTEENEQLLELAWDCLCNLGAIGTRKTRGLGAYAPVKAEDRKVDALMKHPIVRRYFSMLLHETTSFGNFKEGRGTTQILSTIAATLTRYRGLCEYYSFSASRKHHGPEATFGPSVFGNAIGVRQSSAVRFRPVLINNNVRLCILKAPDFTLCEEAKKNNIKNLEQLEQ